MSPPKKIVHVRLSDADELKQLLIAGSSSFVETGSNGTRKLPLKERSASLIRGISKVTLKPGIKRTAVFRAGRGKRVYAYSIHPRDITKIVREDQNGKKVTGRFVNGQFRPLRAKSA